jgi:hypothetical protein
MMPSSKTLVSLSAALVAGMFLIASPILASDTTEKKVTEKEVCVTQYGGGTECKKEVIEEEIKHEQVKGEVTHATVDAGLEDVNWLGIATVMGVFGITFFALSKFTSKVYLLD